jgi:acylphosphatase
MQKRQVYIVISGRVQGVGFRYFAMYKAEELDITGWVKNTPEGKLEIEASGELQNINTFIDWMKIGPARAIIGSFSVSDISPERTFTQFTIH